MEKLLVVSQVLMKIKAVFETADLSDQRKPERAA